MDSTIDLLDSDKALDLNHIRYQLIRLEDTIIFNLIERAQFPLNPTIYTQTPRLPLPGFKGSFMEWMLYQQESVYARVRRYQAPDEYPFFEKVKAINPILKPLAYPKLLWPNDVNINEQIKEVYVNNILPAICRGSGVYSDDDTGNGGAGGSGDGGAAVSGRGDRGEQLENYGSTAVADVAVLQALSRRIHFGKFVAESKFLSEREIFTQLIEEENREEIGNRITKKKVEEEVLRRLRYKAKIYGRDPTLKPGEGGLDDDVGVKKIDVEAVVKMYRDFVIPLTKDVEVEYLMQRLQDPKPEAPMPQKLFTLKNFMFLLLFLTLTSVIAAVIVQVLAPAASRSDDGTFPYLRKQNS
ncbi:chorismate mutase aro7 [Arthrobotrys megalospora]